MTIPKEPGLQTLEFIVLLIFWMTKWNTLHFTVTTMYVVDGYQVSIVYEASDQPAMGPYEAPTLAEAFALAIADTKGFRPHFHSIVKDDAET